LYISYYDLADNDTSNIMDLGGAHGGAPGWFLNIGQLKVSRY